MKNYLKSFFLPYLVVPIFFYAVDMACQGTFYNGDGGDIFALTVFLTFAAGLSFTLLLRQKWIAFDKLYAAAAGGFLGLVQGFVVYLGIGTTFVWHKDVMQAQKWTVADTKEFFYFFFQPWLNLNNYICDGAGWAILLSGVVFFVIVQRTKKGLR
jgi:hypothetical protein